MTRRYTEQEWISLARQMHQGRYVYEGCGYIGMVAKVAICCPDHGRFVQRAQDHVKGSGCPHCATHARKGWVHYSGAVGNAAIQEVLAARTFYDADNAVVVSNAQYTAAARQLARKGNVRLLHHDELPSLASGVAGAGGHWARA